MVDPRVTDTNTARLTVRETVYYQGPEGQPLSVETRFWTAVESDEQPYIRQQEVGEDWVALDCGWLEELEKGVVTLHNPEPRWRVNPTPEERATAEARVIEIAFKVPGTGTISYPLTPVLVLPIGTGQRLHILDLSIVRLRCRSGKVRVQVHVFPG